MSDITPEKLAAALAGGFVAEDDLNGWVSVSATDNVASIEFTPIRHEPGKDGIQHFRVVVVEGEGPVVVVSAQFLAAARALYRWHIAASTLAAEQFAALVYEVDDSLAALTPDQVAVLAGDDEQAAQAEQSGGQP